MTVMRIVEASPGDQLQELRYIPPTYKIVVKSGKHWWSRRLYYIQSEFGSVGPYAHRSAAEQDLAFLRSWEPK